MIDSPRIFEILVIDDNPADARLLKEGWLECGLVKSNVRVLHDPKEAIAYLKHRNPFENAPRPDLIMLDYAMPTNGGAALAEIKADPTCQKIPAIVITGSVSPIDICDIYMRGANCCMPKPGDMQGYFNIVEKVAGYWLQSVMLPPHHVGTSA